MNRKHVATLAALVFAIALCVSVVPFADDSSAEADNSKDAFVADSNALINEMISSPSSQYPFVQMVKDADGKLNLVIDLYRYQSADINMNGMMEKVMKFNKGYNLITIANNVVVDEKNVVNDGLKNVLTMFIGDLYSSLGSLEVADELTLFQYPIEVQKLQTKDNEETALDVCQTYLKVSLKNVNEKTIGFVEDLSSIVGFGRDGEGINMSLSVLYMYDKVSIREILTAIQGLTCDDVFGFEYSHMYNMVFGTLMGMSNFANAISFETKIMTEDGEKTIEFDFDRYVPGTGVDNYQRFINGMLNAMKSEGWDVDVSNFHIVNTNAYVIDGAFLIDYPDPQGEIQTFSIPMYIEVFNIDLDVDIEVSEGGIVYLLPTLKEECVALGFEAEEGYALKSLSVTISKEGEEDVVKNLYYTRAFTMVEGYDYVVNGVFEKTGASQYTVTYDGNDNTGGEVPVDPNKYNAGDVATVLGVDESFVKQGYTFLGWKIAGDDKIYQAGETFTVNENIILEAQWKSTSDVYQIIIPILTNGVIKTVGDVLEVPAGGSVTFQIIAAADYRVDSVSVNGKHEGAVTILTVKNIQDDIRIEATFASAPGYVTEMNEDGSITETYTKDNVEINKTTAVDGNVTSLAKCGGVSAYGTIDNVYANIEEPTAEKMANAVIALKAAAEAINSPLTPIIAVKSSDNQIDLGESVKALAGQNVELALIGEDAAIKFDKDAVATLAGKEGSIVIKFGPGEASDLNDKQKEIVGDNVFYDLSILVNNEILSDFGGKAKVKLDYEPDDDDAKIVVYYVSDAGEKSKIDSTYASGTIEIELTHFSIYMIAEETTEPEPGPSSGGSDNTMFIIIGVVAAILVIGVVAYFYMKKN